VAYQRCPTVERLKFLARDGRNLAQAAIQFVLAHPAVTVTVPGAKSVKQLEENLAALFAPPLTRADAIITSRNGHVMRMVGALSSPL